MLWCAARRWQFGLPLVFGAMTLVAVVFAFRDNQIKAERAAVSAVHQMHGAVLDGPLSSTPAGAWQRLWFGPSTRPTTINFRFARKLFDHPEALAEIQPHLKRLGALRSLSLEGTAVGDEQLPLLAELTQLEVLNLRDTFATDEGVARLKEQLPGCRIDY